MPSGLHRKEQRAEPPRKREHQTRRALGESALTLWVYVLAWLRPHLQQLWCWRLRAIVADSVDAGLPFAPAARLTTATHAGVDVSAAARSAPACGDDSLSGKASRGGRRWCLAVPGRMEEPG